MQQKKKLLGKIRNMKYEKSECIAHALHTYIIYYHQWRKNQHKTKLHFIIS